MREYDPRHSNDHLEDFDSVLGDVEAGSRSATISGSTRNESTPTPVPNNNNNMMSDHDNASAYDESIRRGVLNAQIQANDETIQSPDAFLKRVLNASSFSVTTGCMDEMMEHGQTVRRLNSGALSNDDLYDDTFTFDGSTITSAHDITHKRSAPQHAVVQFNPEAHAATVDYQQQKHEFASVMSKTANSSRTEKSERSKVARICFGLGKVGILLAFLAILAVSVAVILFLLLGNKDSTETPTSVCCQGKFEEGWSGREICNAQGGCCVVCLHSVVQTNPNGPEINTALPTSTPTPMPSRDPSTRAPDTTVPQTNTSLPLTEQPTLASTTTSQPITPEPTTPQPTFAVTTPRPTDAGTTGSPTISPTLEPPTAAPTRVDIVDDTQTPTTLANAGEVGAEILAPSVPCCSDSQWSDFIGRVRCADRSDASTCCQVCTLT